MRRLPQEIVDSIVDHISDDRKTLLACTQLSRAWCIAARIHLHWTFTVSHSAGLKAVDDLEIMGTIHLVRKMVVSPKQGQMGFLLPHKALIRLNAFNHLQELVLTCYDIGELVLGLHENCDTLKSTVRTLTLQYPSGSTKRIVWFISLFSNLENLAVHDSMYMVNTEDPQVPVTESPPLKGWLNLKTIWKGSEFICDLASMQHGMRFRTVELCGSAGVQGVINGCGRTMERLIWYAFHILGA